MFRMLLVVVSVCTALSSGTLAVASQNKSEPFAKTCSYFSNRAAAYRVGEQTNWLLLLSQSCNEALGNLTSARAKTTGVTGSADLTYLQRLNELRDIVVSMNVARFTERRQATGSIRKTVTSSGEYLIAHRIGVMDAYHTWIAASEVETAALPKP